ncbi:hypothetical protein C7974DRAFT_301691 [Boeremia exigua]|uniref:uncharacterized protein n=1 Tax=Boeremia exigua TaxID=749465 RepID=UPI001E8ED7EE|nr:uncharacterized protein C7974DRAFT_301691 [Boeremia exigua]KAH6641993.1 hypothetical protein C7974DRAFT_301691 [Boeremia exigua]
MPRKRTTPKRQTKLSFSPTAKPTAPATTTAPKKSARASKRQTKIDVRNIAPKGRLRRGSESSEDELQEGLQGLPVRARSDGVFGVGGASEEEESGESQSEEEKPKRAGRGGRGKQSESEEEKPKRAGRGGRGKQSESEESDESQSEEEKPKTRPKRGSRKRQRAESSDEGTVTVVQRKRARQAESEDDEELRVPGKRRRVGRGEATESEEEPAPPRSVRRRLTKRPAAPDDDEDTSQQITPDEGEEENGSGADSDAEEQEELKEELAFLRSSPPSGLRSTQDRPKNKRQEALEALKRRRAGSTQEPPSTPARKPRVVVESESDSGSELEIIKEEPDSDEVGDPESSVEDDDEDDDREANALDMFQEDEDDTGFIDDDPDAVIGEPDDDQAQLPMQFSSMSRAKPKDLFKYAVEWMVMKKIHPGFNPNDEIYELTFRKLGDEVKGLASSKFTSAAWTSDFTRAINARPDLFINDIGGVRRELLSDHCEACNRKNHPATFELSLTGTPYNPESLEPLDSAGSDSDSNSDSDSSLSASETNLNGEKPTRDFRGDRIPPASKTFTLGSTCKANAQVAHTLHHWRYHLNDWVKDWLQSNGHLTPEKLVKRDKKSDRRREKEARKIVDEMESKGEIRKLHRLYKDQVQFAVEAVNDFKRGWGRR